MYRKYESTRIKTEEEALKQLGSVEEVIQQVYQENHVKYQKDRQKVEKNSLLDNFVHTIYQVVDVMSHNTLKENGKILFDLLLLILFTCILKIPFIFVRSLGMSFLTFLSSPILERLWYFGFELVYLFVAVLFFVRIFRKWFQELPNFKINL